MKKSDWQAVGRILRTEGRGGELKVKLYPGVKLGSVRSIALERRGENEEWGVESVRPDRNCLVLKVKGLDSQAQAEALTGQEMKVLCNNLLPPEEGSFYPSQLLGCRVLTRGGADLGQVTDVLPIADSGLLVVGRGGQEIYIPLAQAICYEIDPQGGYIRVDPPEGLLNLNEI